MSDTEVTGLDALTSTLRVMGAELADMSAVTKVVAERGASAARGAIPRRSGALAGSVMSTSTATGGAVRIGAGLPYAAAINSGIGPRPGLRGPHNIRPAQFLRAARQSVTAAADGAYTTALSTAVSKVRGA